jgi:CHAD domain-containing protein
METEAKFALPDREAFERLQAVEHLAGYVLSAHQVTRVRDTYLDTADRAVLAAGYACRVRRQEDGLLVTLKGLGGAEGPIHRREEWEVALEEEQPPSQWPEGPVRELVLEVVGDAPLFPLFELEQTRSVRLIQENDRLIAEMSLDDVRLTVEGMQHAYYELEVELLPDGTADDLAAITVCLLEEWGLQPVSRSKFERALALVDASHSVGELLTPAERTACLRIAEADDEYGLRSRALLALDEGMTQAQAAERSGLSRNQVRYWLGKFRDERMAIFPAAVTAELDDAASPPDDVVMLEPIAPHGEAGVTNLLDQPGLAPDDTMAEAARKTLLFHFQRMLYHEPGTRAGDDIEELHKMRVATRRMRSAYQIFADYVNQEQMAPFVKGMRRTGSALGGVRDLDVFWEKAQHYLDTLPPEQQANLALLRMAWEAEREHARVAMIDYLDGARYSRFKERFGAFLQTPGAGAVSLISEKGEALPARLRHVVPMIVWERMAAVRAYDDWVTAPDVSFERMHRLRIAAKGLRYTLEFFREILGPETEPLIKEIKRLQDHLGDLQDAVVASNLLRDFLTWGTWPRGKKRPPMPSEPIVDPGVAAYLTTRQIEIQDLLTTFPELWSQFQSPTFSQLVTDALGVLK